MSLRFILNRLSLTAVSVMYIVPLIWMVATALKSSGTIAREPSNVFFTPTLDALRNVWHPALTASIVSTEIALGTVILVLLLGAPAAYALSRAKSDRWRVAAPLVLGALVLLQMVPQATTVIPLYVVLTKWHLINSTAGVVVADTALLLPFAIVLLRPFFVAVPRAIEQAALVDGASDLAIFLRIVLPLVRNGLVTVGILLFITTWGEFLYAVTFLSNPDVLPVSAVLAQRITAFAVDWNGLMALSTLTSIPVVVLFLICQRRLVEGLTLGAVK